MTWGESDDQPRCGDCGHRPGCECPHYCHYPEDANVISIRDVTEQVAELEALNDGI